MMQVANVIPVDQSRLSIESVQSYGVDSCRGNLVGVQPYMVADDYATAASFQTKLDDYLTAVQAEGWLHPNSIVIFPENIGTWLLLIEEHKSIFQQKTIDDAVKKMIRHKWLHFLCTRFQVKAPNRNADALFRMKAQQMAELYQETFSHLASKYQITIVAGSIFLPEPTIENGRLQISNGPLQNVSCVFKPNGRIHPKITRKNNLVGDENDFLNAGELTDIPVYETPAGRLGVLICADSWYPSSYAVLAGQDVDLIAVPNNQGNWQQPWPGYSTTFVPQDVDLQDVGKLTEREAWLKYALPSRMSCSGARAGMHVFFHGRLWDQVSEGQTLMVYGKEVTEAPNVDKAALINMWL